LRHYHQGEEPAPIKSLSKNEELAPVKSLSKNEEKPPQEGHVERKNTLQTELVIEGGKISRVEPTQSPYFKVKPSSKILGPDVSISLFSVLQPIHALRKMRTVMCMSHPICTLCLAIYK
jgi:hypothetical protein